MTNTDIYLIKKNQTPTKIENLARVQKFCSNFKFGVKFQNSGKLINLYYRYISYISFKHSWRKLDWKRNLKVVRGHERSNFNFYVKYANITEVQTAKEFRSLFEIWQIIYKIDTYRFSFSKKEVFRSPEVIILLTLI